MKSAEHSAAEAIPARMASFGRAGSSKVSAAHLDKLALVYVRQSTTQQVLEHRESTARQYAFADRAVELGWPRDRVVIIDDDLGKSGRSAEGRDGFQRLVAEVTLNHVGLVLGLEMSRLARSSKDWHVLFELCGVYGTLLADEDGVYDANDANDRLLLGLKGIMSEMELHMMRNRLDRGRLNKARRGEFFSRVPFGYVIVPAGGVAFDPDEQVRDAVRLIFAKFDEMGTVYAVLHWLADNDVRLPMRVYCGANKGELEWRRPAMGTLLPMLQHPMYAGAYTYGRRSAKANGQLAQSRSNRPWLPKEQWQVLIKDRLPAYITWEQYEKNCQRIHQNCSRPDTPGAPREGCALLGGVLTCSCGHLMQPHYLWHGVAQYHCKRYLVEAREKTCFGLSASVIDTLVSQQLLRALEPAALQLSLQAGDDIEGERRRLDKHWQQQLQRARYDVNLAERRYRAVDPDNRLVAATLEKQWEEALANQRQAQEDYDRFQQAQPLPLTKPERARIEALAADIPALWSAPHTTNIDRKAMIRCLIKRVEVQVLRDSEFVDVVIHWAGGFESRHEIIRPVATYAQLRDFEQLMERIVELREAGHMAAAIADQLNAEGFHSPKGRSKFNRPVIYQLLRRRGLIGDERCHDELLGEGEWWLSDLARKLNMCPHKLRDWASRNWIHSRRTPIQNRWILWADEDELERLRQLLAESKRGVHYNTSELKTPKKRPEKP